MGKIMDDDIQYFCPECDKIFTEKDSRLSGELFCPICKSRLEVDNSTYPELVQTPSNSVDLIKKKHQGIISVEVKDINMPFMSMVLFMVKWAIAAIPAMIILLIVGGLVSAILGSFFSFF